jgi:hypothetical protein
VQRMLSAFHSATIPDLPTSVATYQELLSPEHRRPLGRRGKMIKLLGTECGYPSLASVSI